MPAANTKKATLPGFKSWKPRREFRAYLIHSLNLAGARLPPDPTYVELREALDAVLARLP